MARGSILRRLARRIAREAADARLLRASMLKPRLSQAAGRWECTVDLAGVGPITIRPSEPDWESFRRIFADGEYDLPVPEPRASIRTRYEKIIAEGATPVIVDAGAYVGAASLWFRRSFPRAHVIAVEPDPESFGLLERNLDSEDGTSVVNAAAGAAPGFVRMVAAGESWANQVTRSEAGVPVLAMNDAFASVPGGEPFLAKINVEGFETDIFSGQLEWLDRISALFIEPHDWLFPGQHKSRSFQKALGERDFHLFIVGPHLCYARI